METLEAWHLMIWERGCLWFFLIFVKSINMIYQQLGMLVPQHIMIHLMYHYRKHSLQAWHLMIWEQRMFVVGVSGDDVNQYDLSTAWDVSTATYNDSFDVSSQEIFPTGVAFNDMGTRMFVVGSDSDMLYNMTFRVYRKNQTLPLILLR